MQRNRRRLLQIAIAASAVGGSIVLVACVDLFHSTSFQTLCDVDASAPGCGASVEAGPVSDAQLIPDANPDAGLTDFCALDATTARASAAHACAWLGACEGPYEHNPLGQCILEAIQAFDCTARPNMKVKGPIFEYWGCLASANSCADVDRCIPARGCPGDPVSFNSCADDVTRVACASSTPQGHPLFVANCAAQGRHCVQPDPKDSISYCVASNTSNDAGCNSGCEGSVLHDCEDGGVSYPLDLGRDCRNIGAGTCTTSDAGASVCAPLGTACATGTIVCSDKVAIDCRSGVEDRVDCSKLGDPMTVTCQTGDAGATIPVWDPAFACVGPDTCGADFCMGTTLVGCANGITHTVNCAKVGMKTCVVSAPVPVAPDFDPTEVRAQCKP